MTQQYGRKVSVIVGPASGEAIELSDFRVSFQIRRGDVQTPNTADVRIYNLSEQTANRIRKEFTRIVVQAGYEGNFGLIFDGTIKQVRKGRDNQTENYVEITAADGDRAYNFSTLALSLAAGSTPSDAVQAFIKSMADAGIESGYVPQLSESGCVRGRVFYGMARDELRDFSNANNCAWSIQDGKFTLIPLKGYIPGEVPVLSSDSGLIGMPEQSESGIKVRCLLNPSLKIGRCIKIDNATVNQMRLGVDIGSQARNQFLLNTVKTNSDGLYYVMLAEHSGDTRSNDFYTELVCLAVDAQIPESIIERAAIAPEAAAIKVP